MRYSSIAEKSADCIYDSIFTILSHGNTRRDIFFGCWRWGRFLLFYTILKGNGMKYCPECKTKLKEMEIDGKVRLVCPGNTCNFIFWDNPLPVVAGIVEKDENIILAHNVSWPKKMYSLITGFLERGESPDQGIRREVKEELGLNAENVELVGVYPFKPMNQVIIAYHIIAHGEISLNEELDDYKIIPKNKLKGWSFGVGLAVADWVKTIA